jgi:hypothetical protein
VPAFNGIAKQFRIVFSQQVAVNPSAASKSVSLGVYDSLDEDDVPVYNISAAGDAWFVDSTQNLYAVVKDEDLQVGLPTASDDCSVTNAATGCELSWQLYLPNGFIQNYWQRTACLGGEQAACAKGLFKSNNVTGDLDFKTVRTKPVDVTGHDDVDAKGHYPSTHEVEYSTYSSYSTIAIQFTKPITLGAPTAYVTLEAQHNAYNSKNITVASGQLYVVGQSVVVREPLVPGESYKLIASDHLVRDSLGYLNEFTADQIEDGEDTSIFGVAPLIRFRQNAATPADETTQGEVSSGGNGLFPGNSFAVCAVNRDNMVTVAGGYITGEDATLVNDGLYQMTTARVGNAYAAMGPFSLCTAPCSDTEQTSSKSILAAEATGVSGFPALNKNGVIANDHVTFEGAVTSSPCALKQCVNCISGPILDECTTKDITPALSSNSSDFVQVLNEADVKAFSCLPGLHAVGKADGVRALNITCKSVSFGYKWNLATTSVNSTCGSTTKVVDKTCLPDKCLGTGVAPTAEQGVLATGHVQLPASSSCKATGKVLMYGDSCDVECQPGYKKKDEAAAYKVKCVADATKGTAWSGMIDTHLAASATDPLYGCDPKVCAPLAGPSTKYDLTYSTDVDADGAGEKATKKITKNCVSKTGAVSFGEYCIAKCAYGYNWKGVNGNSRVVPLACGANGTDVVVQSYTAAGASTDCAQLTCSRAALKTAYAAVAAFQSLDADKCGNTFGEGCVTTCAAGTEIAPGKTTATLTCVCKDAACTELAYYDSATAEKLWNDKTGSGVFQEWTSLCGPKKCPPLAEETLTARNELPMNSTCSGNNVVNGECATKCKEGFAVSFADMTKTEVKYKCQLNGNDMAWTRTTAGAACVPITTTPAAPRAKLVTQKITTTIGVDLGSFATVNDYFVANKAALKGSFCSTLIENLDSSICAMDMANPTAAKSTWCTALCTSCLDSCDVSIQARRILSAEEAKQEARNKRRRRLATADLNVAVDYAVTTTEDNAAALETSAKQLASTGGKAAFSSSLGTNLQKNNLVVTSISVKDVEEVAVDVAPKPSTGGDDDEDDNTGAIVGGVVGGVVGAAVLGFVLFKVLKKKQ